MGCRAVCFEVSTACSRCLMCSGCGSVQPPPRARGPRRLAKPRGSGVRFCCFYPPPSAWLQAALQGPLPLSGGLYCFMYSHAACLSPRPSRQGGPLPPQPCCKQQGWAVYYCPPNEFKIQKTVLKISHVINCNGRDTKRYNTPSENKCLYSYPLDIQ